MTALAVIRRARRRLVAVALAKGGVWAAIGGFAVLASLLLLDALAGLSSETRSRLTVAPWLSAGLTLAWHGLGPVREALRASDEALALWFERRIPGLRYALVTQVGLPSEREELRAEIARAPLERTLAEAARANLVRPTGLALVLALVVWLLPAGAVARVLRPAVGDALDRPGSGTRAFSDPTATIVVRIRPPAYTGLGERALDDPSTVDALIGSRVRIEGRGRDVRAAIGERPLRVAEADGRWQVLAEVPERVAAVRLAGARGERVLVLEPVRDSAPGVRLLLPARDTVFRVASGMVQLSAELHDDFGLAEASFELIASSGAGELFTFRTLHAARQTFAAGTRRATLAGTLRLDTLALAAGDLVHLRAIARDRNDVTGPGRGASETRTLRIARADEYDSVSVEAVAPSEPEKNALSQRMILLQTQDLVARSPRLDPAALAREARTIAVDQTKLRKRVGEVVFIRLGENEGEHVHFAGDGHDHGEEGLLDPASILAAAERAANADPTLLDAHGDETPIVAINRPLLDAYNHMWRATGELETANPAGAIPWMERAIEALQRARAAERIYLRGRPPRVVVDIARVRLAGKDEATPGARSPGAPVDPDRAQRLQRFDRALVLAVDDPRAAADSLLLLRVALPETERAAARALDAAAVVLRRGGDATAALAAAHRALWASAPRRQPLSAWGR